MGTIAAASSYRQTGSTTTRASSPRWGIRIGGAIVCLAVALGGYWSVATLTASSKPAGYGDRWVGVPGGVLRVDEATEINGRKVPDRFRRFRLTVTVESHKDVMVVDASSFRIDGYHVYLGMKPIKATPSAKRIKPGKKATIGLVYQVTSEADNFSLIFEGSRTSIPFQLHESPS